jgi:hypothetical protein
VVAITALDVEDIESACSLTACTELNKITKVNTRKVKIEIFFLFMNFAFHIFINFTVFLYYTILYSEFN